MKSALEHFWDSASELIGGVLVRAWPALMIVAADFVDMVGWLNSIGVVTDSGAALIRGAIEMFPPVFYQFLVLLVVLWAVLKTFHLARLSPPPPGREEPTLSLHESLAYLVFDSKRFKGRLPPEGGVSDLDREAILFIQQHARIPPPNNLVIWGRIQTGDNAHD